MSAYFDVYKMLDIVVQLVVIRGITFSSPLSENLNKWLTQVVTTACSYRRNIRVREIYYYLLWWFSNIH